MLGKRKFAALGHVVFEVVMVLVALAFIYPILLMVINSVKPFGEVVSDAIALPKTLRFENYSEVLDKMHYVNLFVNNLVVTSIGIVGIVAFSSLAAYILDRRRTRYTRLVYNLLIIPMLIPFQTFMITLLKAMTLVHLSGSTWGLGIQYWGFGVPMAVFVYFNFMTTIPKELDESASIDGATTFRTFCSIIFPMLQTITATVIVLDVMWIWNDFLLPLLMVNGRPETKTLVLAAYNFVGQFNTQWHYAMTAMVMTVAPSVLIFILLQRYIVKGVVAGAIKA
jgi:raffinose/stachyose/melibiose transport system permease protein